MKKGGGFSHSFPFSKSQFGKHFHFQFSTFNYQFILFFPPERR